MSAIAPFDAATSLDSPHVIHGKLLEIERDLAIRQNSYEHVTGAWERAQREIRKAYAIALIGSTASSVTEQKAEADLAALAVEGSELKPEFEATRVAVQMLEKRSIILMSLLKSQGRA